MVFSSVTFLFYFLPAVLLLYSISGPSRNYLLLIASLFFYAWGEGSYVLIMLLSIGGNFLFGKAIGKNIIKRKNILLLLGLLFNLCLLGYFKYANFVTENINNFSSLFGLPNISLQPVHLPIGISFFTFQAISYLVDVFRGVVPYQKNICSLGLYISLFPQLIAGPIVRYASVSEALIHRQFSPTLYASGIRRFIIGFSKKILLANPLGFAADKIFNLPSDELTLPLTWLGAICYTLQIYYDFSGYSDMAIGLGRMFGFRFLENFNYPYIASSIKDFWKRWHISLSSWFRDYLYIPLGGNKRGSLRTGCNLLIVFFLCGLWHGASWTFVIWGVFHGCFLILERSIYGKWLKRQFTIIRHSVTLVIIIVGWVIFRSNTLHEAIIYLSVMFGFQDFGGKQLLTLYLDSKLITELFFACLFSTPIFLNILNNLNRIQEKIAPKHIKLICTICFETCKLASVCVLAYFSVISLASGAYNPFIYFRF